ncbi:MAG: hypothetical protein LBU32_24085 [Clostridiales bacterium]|nr:hypothetical protein [Clostridiales bacterium]
MFETKENAVIVPAKIESTKPPLTPTPMPAAGSSYSVAPLVPSSKPAFIEFMAKAANPGNLADLRSAAVPLSDELYKLGLFVGTGTDASEKPAYELNRQLSRIEALALEYEANAHVGFNPFSDGSA